MFEEHGRVYRDPGKVGRNKQTLKARSASGMTWIDHGIDRYQGREAEVIHTLDRNHSA